MFYERQQRINFCFLKVTSEIQHSISNCKFNKWYVFPREDENSRLPVGFYHVGKSANNRQLQTGNLESFDLILFLINRISILFIENSSRSSHSELFLGEGVLRICRKYAGEHPCKIVILIKLLCNFTETTLQHGCTPVNLLHIFRKSFPKNTSGYMHLQFKCIFYVNLNFKFQ